MRLMISLARHYGNSSVSTRRLAKEQDVSYQLACKLMQRLHDARLVDSCMGPRGGFRLSRAPAQISLMDVVQTIQGPIGLNRCLLDESACPRGRNCPIRKKISELQDHMEEYLSSVTLDDLLEGGKRVKKQRRLHGRLK